MYKHLLFAALSLATACTMILLLHPIAGRLRLLDVPGGRKSHKTLTPLVGGIGIYCGLLLASFGITDWLQQVAPFLFASGLLVVIGMLDDRHDIRKRVRLIAQLIAALLMVYWAEIRVDHLGDLLGTGPLALGLLAVPFTIIATIAVINAANMIDGADGLAGGLSLIALIFLTSLAYAGGRLIDAQILSLLACSVIAFMLFNYRLPGRTRAYVFLGDAGSTFLGFAVCWFAIKLSQGPQAIMPPILAVWLFAIPLLDMLAAIIRRMLSGQSPMAADRKHTHHLLLRHGFSTAATVNLILCSAIIAAALATLALVKLNAPEALLLLAFLACVAIHMLFVQRQIKSLQLRAAHTVNHVPAHYHARTAANTETIASSQLNPHKSPAPKNVNKGTGIA